MTAQTKKGKSIWMRKSQAAHFGFLRELNPRTLMKNPVCSCWNRATPHIQLVATR